ncbi:MAG: hypothetical protein AAGF23_12630, partial [Acidobacteriota bacterium]
MDSDFFDDDADHDFDGEFDEADLPEDVRQAFRRDMEAFEQIEPAAPLDALRASGVELPEPEDLG